MFVRGDNEEGPAAAITQLIVTIQQATPGFNPTLVGRELVIRPTSRVESELKLILLLLCEEVVSEAILSDRPDLGPAAKIWH